MVLHVVGVKVACFFDGLVTVPGRKKLNVTVSTDSRCVNVVFDRMQAQETSCTLNKSSLFIHLLRQFL